MCFSTTTCVTVRTRAGAGSVCPQDIVLWNNLTCLEQLVFIGQMYGLSGRSARARGIHLLDDIGLGEKRDALAKTLSGGMQRRLNLIMALVHDPDLLVLDEPEVGLDPQGRILVREYIRAIARHKTIVGDPRHGRSQRRPCRVIDRDDFSRWTR